MGVRRERAAGQRRWEAPAYIGNIECSLPAPNIGRENALVLDTVLFCRGKQLCIEATTLAVMPNLQPVPEPNEVFQWEQGSVVCETDLYDIF